MRASRAAAAVVLTVIALALAACGGSSGEGTGEAGSVTTVSTQSAPTKRVVLSAQGQSFDPEAIYHAAAPGVVTVLSIFPGGSLPSILGGMRVGVTLAVVGAIVGEWAGAEKGLGVLINLARGSMFDIPLMFATLLTIALVGIVLYLVVVLIERRLVGAR